MGCAKPEEVETAGVKAEGLLAGACVHAAVLAEEAVGSVTWELTATGGGEAGACPSAGPSGGGSPSVLASPGADVGAGSLPGAASEGAVGCPPLVSAAAEGATSAGRCSGAGTGGWGSSWAVAPSARGGFSTGLVLTSSSPLLARAAGVAAELKRLPKERLVVGGGRAEDEEDDAWGALA